MPGPAFLFTTLKKTIEQLVNNNDPQGTIMRNNPAFAHLGVLGPDILMHVSIEDQALLGKIEDVLNGTVDPNTLGVTEMLALHRNLLTVAYSTLFVRFRELWPVLDKIHAFLDKIDGIAAAEDSGALSDMEGEMNDLQGSLASFTNMGGNAANIQQAFGQIITLFRPNIQADSATAQNLQTREFTWRLWEFLRWRGSGTFARKLVELAKQETGSRSEALLAYAYGYMCHIATAVTCNPFINNIVGGPYRTHWWRNRYVRNFVDVWTHGRFNTSNASITGDEPTPSYEKWENLSCNGNLQDKIQFESTLGGEDAVDAVVKGMMPADALPEFLADFLAKAVDQAYTSGPEPLPPGSFSAATFKNGYVGTVAVLWFMTSGQRPICISPPGAPPSDCTDPPDWVTSGGTPPKAGKDEFVDGGKVASAIVLAILALLAFLTGQWLAGLGAVAGIIALADSGFVEWDELRCHLYWLRFFLFQKENAVRESLVWATMAYPLTRELGVIKPDGSTDPARDTSGRALCHTSRVDRYPRQMDASTEGNTVLLPDLNFARYPQSPIEQPSTTDWPTSHDYPEMAVNGAAWVPVSGDLTDNTPANFPAKKVGGQPAYFGNAVLNSVALIKKEGQDLVDYNLDSDRGYGWMAWRHKPNTFPSSPPVDVQAP